MDTRNAADVVRAVKLADAEFRGRGPSDWDESRAFAAAIPGPAAELDDALMRSAVLRMEAEDLGRRLTLPLDELRAALSRVDAHESAEHPLLLVAREKLVEAITARESDDDAVRLRLFAELETTLADARSVVLRASDALDAYARWADEDRDDASEA